MIIWIDEVWRWPWFWEIVAVSFVILDKTILEYEIFKTVTDSKKLTQKKRELIYEQLINLSTLEEPKVSFWIWVVSSDIIDEINIWKANKLAMQKSLQDILHKNNFYWNIQVLIDWNYNYIFDFWDNITYKSVVKWDLKFVEISCASIIAKVFRDKLMWVYDSLYPWIWLKTNAWYWTKKHINYLTDATKITPFHRKSYAPIKKLLIN